MNFLAKQGIQLLIGEEEEQLASNSTDDELIGPTEIDPHTPHEVPDEEGGFSWVALGEDVLILIIIGGVLFLIFLGYLAYQKRYTDLVEEHATNPESQIKAQELTYIEQKHLEEWSFNADKESYLPDVMVSHEESRLGKYFKVKFDQPGGEVRTIISNKLIEKSDKDVCYFEFEIASASIGVNIVIGLGTKESYDPSVLPGQTKESIGFHSKGGILFVDNAQVEAYEMDPGFGETIGLGYNFETNRIYLFCNAKFLNEPPREFGSPSKSASPDKRNTISPAKGRTISPQKGSPVKERKIDLEVKKRAYYPLIGATGPCELFLNIGGSPFSIHHKEIAKGLL